MPFILKLEGDASLIASAIDSFAKQHGWKEAEEGDVDHLDQPTFSAEVIKQFVKESVVAYNANLAATQARELTHTQTNAAVDSLTISFEQNEE